MMLVRCMFCLAAGACEIRWDKRGRPYTSCRYCHTRAFLSSLNALQGVALAPALLDAALKQGEEDPGYKRRLDGMIADLMNFIRNRGTVPTARTNELAQRPEIVPHDYVPQERKAQ